MRQLRLLIPPYFGLDLYAKVKAEKESVQHFNGTPLPIGRA